MKIISGGYSFPLCRSMTHVDIFIQKTKRGKKESEKKGRGKDFQACTARFKHFKYLSRSVSGVPLLEIN